MSVGKEGVGGTQRGPTNQRALVADYFRSLKSMFEYVFLFYFVNLTTKPGGFRPGGHKKNLRGHEMINRR